MEHIIGSSITSHASEHNLQYTLQHGFRNETQVLEFVHDVVQNMQAQQQTEVFVLDLSKRSDTFG